MYCKIQFYFILLKIDSITKIEFFILLYCLVKMETFTNWCMLNGINSEKLSEEMSNNILNIVIKYRELFTLGLNMGQNLQHIGRVEEQTFYNFRDNCFNPLSRLYAGLLVELKRHNTTENTIAINNCINQINEFIKNI